MTEGGRPVGYCVRCGGPLRERDRFCATCGALVLPAHERAEQVTLGQTAPQDSGSADTGEGRGGGYGCSAAAIGALVVGFFVMIGVANGLDEGAGWAVVVFGGPALVLSAVLLLVGPWATRQIDRRNEAEARRREREEYLRELQIRDHEGRR